MNAVIISDIHLGSDICQSKKLKEFLFQIEHNVIQVDEIIINGDLFDSLDFRKLKSSHWKILSSLRSLTKTKHVVWINGNHDGPACFISHVIGVDFVEEYKFKSGEKNFIILHGDKFDNFITKYPVLTKLADKIYRFIQKLDKSFYLANLAKRNSKTFLRCSEQIKQRAIGYCLQNKADVICCGHTHLALETKTSKVHYINSGCWTEECCSYILITEQNVELKKFN